jgi:hypothetical protein
MIAVIFEVEPAEGERQAYLDLESGPRLDAVRIDKNPGKYHHRL